MKNKICIEIERMIGQKFESASDFDLLADMIRERTHTYISPTTLKRIWGYLHEDVSPRKSTLDLLARFAGYKNYSAYIESYGEHQSNPVFSKHLTDKDIRNGQLVRIKWQPDRLITVRHEGNGHFTVVETVNAKLSVGDTFRCHLIIEHEPMYVDSLHHNGNPETCYVAGRKDGVTFEVL